MAGDRLLCIFLLPEFLLKKRTNFFPLTKKRWENKQAGKVNRNEKLLPETGNFPCFALGFNAKSFWNKGTCQIITRKVKVSKETSQDSEGAQVSRKLSCLGTVY